MTSPINTVRLKYQIEPSKWYTRESTHGTIKVFAMIGGVRHRYFVFLSFAVPKAPRRVARLPNTTSHGRQPDRILARMQPTKRPGTAAGVNTGSMHKASEILIWITPLERPAAVATIVKTT